MADDSVCVICSQPFTSSDPAVAVLSGRDLLLTRSTECGDSRLTNLIQSNPPALSVHEACRKRYINKPGAAELSRKRIPGDDSDTSRKLTRTQTGGAAFRWAEDCLLCGKPASIDDRHPSKAAKVRQVKTLGINDSLTALCKVRNDEWSFVVQGRLQTAADLHAADAVYHVNCYRSFSRLSTASSVACEASSSRGGRPADQERRDILGAVYDKLFNTDSELYTLENVKAEMESMAGDESKVYTLVQLQRLLKERYGEDLFIACKGNRRNVVCLQNMAKRVINDKWYEEREMDFDKECERIVQSAAEIIKADVRQTDYSTDEYPVPHAINNKLLSKQWVPKLLQLFLKTLMSDELKQTAVGHCIVQASRPRSALSPLLFGVGVSVDYQTGKQNVVRMLSRLGLSVSPDEVDRFKQSVQWKTLTCASLEPTEWGWKLVDGVYAPIDTDLPAGPQELLNVIHCRCSPSTESPCSTSKCSCRKHGLPCFADCINCYGTKCSNACKQAYQEQAEDTGDSGIFSDTMFYDDVVDDDLCLYEEVVTGDDLDS